MDRKCFMRECTRRIPTANLLCNDHWRQLPGKVRQEINKRLLGWGSRAQAEIFLGNYLRSASKRETAA